jgi:hypothetical protein
MKKSKKERKIFDWEGFWKKEVKRERGEER